MPLTFGKNLGCTFYTGTVAAYKASDANQYVYNCPSASYQTCTNDFMAQGQCLTSSSMLVESALMAQAYSNGACIKTANQDASESLPCSLPPAASCQLLPACAAALPLQGLAPGSPACRGRVHP